MTDFRFARKHIGKAICLFVLLSSIYGIYPSLKKLPASNWIQLITGLSSSATALLVAGIGYKNYQALQQKNATDAETAKQNYQALIDKNTADQFSKAIEQLGNENSIHVRLGGIFALEQIANTDGIYYWQIMEILTAYVRTRSSWKHEKEREEPDPTKPDTDIQAVMTVLGRRKYSYQNGDQRRLDLRSTDLRGLELSPKAKFQGCDFGGAHLENALLKSVDFKETNFFCAHLEEADLREANLENVRLEYANLKLARLKKANLRNSILRRAELQETDLRYADLSGADFSGAKLKEIYFEGANLDKAKFSTIDDGGNRVNAKDFSDDEFNKAASSKNVIFPTYSKYWQKT
jgi:uncharacterized protein YjbI with pentapeptide repeats